MGNEQLTKNVTAQRQEASGRLRASIGSSEFVLVRLTYSGFTQWQGRWQI